MDMALTPSGKSGRNKRRDRIVAVIALVAIVLAGTSLIDPLQFFYKRCFNETHFRGQDLAISALEYARTHHNKLPDAANWEQALGFPKGAPIPTFFWEPPRKFVMNNAFSGKSPSSLPEQSQAVLFFESTSQESSAVFNAAALPPCTARRPLSWAVYANGGSDMILCKARDIVIERSAKQSSKQSQ